MNKWKNLKNIEYVNYIYEKKILFTIDKYWFFSLFLDSTNEQCGEKEISLFIETANKFIYLDFVIFFYYFHVLLITSTRVAKYVRQINLESDSIDSFRVKYKHWQLFLSTKASQTSELFIPKD